MAKTSPGLFVRQVRETVVSVILVFVFSAIIGVYFLIIDRILSFGISLIFG